MVKAVDESIGNITSVLKEVGMWANTTVIFSTDKYVRG
jgi:arylsulfatase A-like enzyme